MSLAMMGDGQGGLNYSHLLNCEVNKILPYALPSCRYFVIEMENRIMHLR
jgi:hypothetical protein